MIKSLQYMIYDVLAVPAAPPSASPASSSYSSSSSTPAPTPAWVPKRELEGAEALAGAVKVARLEGRGKMAAAAAELESFPHSSHVGPETISNASRAMGHPLFRRLQTIGMVLDSFFARPAVSVAMSTHLKSRTDSVDDSTIDEVIVTPGFYCSLIF